MQNEQHQLENKIHAERLIRRKVRGQGHEISEDLAEKLVGRACEEALEESASWDHRKQRIEAVVHDYLGGKISLDSPKEKPEPVEEPAEEPVTGQTLLESIDGLTPGVIAALEAKNIKSLEQIAAFKASGGDFTQISGVGVATAAKLESLLAVEEDDAEEEVESETD